MSDDLKTIFVLSEQRTGSNLLCDLLSQTPEMPGMSELFNTDKDQELLSMSSEDRLEWLGPRVNRSQRPGGSFGGGKLMFEHLESLDIGLAELLDKFDQPKVICLFRRNLIDQYISLRQAQISGNWVAQGDGKSEAPPVVNLVRGEVFDFCERAATRYQKALRILRHAGIAHVVVSYEELVARRDVVLDSVVGGLVGIPLREAEPSLRRQRTAPRSEVVDDTELLSALEGAGWARQRFVTTLETDVDGEAADDLGMSEARYQRLLKNIGWLPGHFYSPYPDLAAIKPGYDALCDPQTQPKAVDLALPSQLELLDMFAGSADQITLNGRGAYSPDNPAYRAGDALVLAHMLHHRRPARLVEVGSGFSSSLLSAARQGGEAPEQSSFEYTVIDPYPERVLSLLDSDELAAISLHRRPVQEEPLETFQALEDGDILFVDSSHVSKPASDVNHLFFEVLPALKTGVRVHFHDIQFPFEYRWDWVAEGRAWNESYLLRAFLQFNTDFKVLFFTDMLAKLHPAEMRTLGPEYEASGSSIWLERVARSN